MLTPAEAVAAVLDHARPLGRVVELELAQVLGRVLAREVRSDLDLPPFPKSAMDGYAVRRADLEGADAEHGVRLRVLGESSAGRPYDGPIGPGECVAIYTGAVLPADCDAVVMVEKSERDGEHVVLRDAPRPRQHVCERGEDLKEGELVLEPGRRLAPADLAVLASVGCDPVPVFRRPRVAVLTTGDELVPPSSTPGPGEIREGNTLQLAALATLAGAQVVRRAVLPDDSKALERGFAEALIDADVLVTTGGVSMGQYDLVGAALEAVGVRQVFHKVAIKPGKPVWFGAQDAKPVFGLPGNPVSCLVGFEVFVRPALARMGGAGAAEQGERLRRGRWRGAPTRENARQQNIPVRVTPGDDGVELLEAVPWRSSGDIVGITRAQGLAVVPPGEVVEEGQLVPYRPLDGTRP
jgi:molybdopterin molybdotransferase